VAGRDSLWQYLDEVIALVLVIGCLVLLFTGRDSEIKSILTISAGWAFGRTFGEIRARRRRG